MRVKLVNLEHAVGMLDPQTKRSPFIGADGKAVDTADVPENVHWTRRVRSGELVRLETTTPVGNEPIAPLTTR